MDILDDISNNKFVLVMLSEKEYDEKLLGIVSHLESHQICYVCLSKPYRDVIEQFKRMNLDYGKFFFIDVLTSHYSNPSKTQNCIFLDNPSNLEQIQSSVNIAISKHNCSTVVFDTISSLLVYEHGYNMVKFTHNLAIHEESQKINKIFIVLKDGDYAQESDSIVKDIQMFADKTIG